MWVAAVALFVGLPVAQAAEPLAITTTVNKVIVDPQGKELLLSAERAEPRDTLLYRAKYQNHSDHTLREVRAVLPIPPGLNFVTGSSQPAALEASVDGKTFFPVAAAPASAPATTWRALRWAPRDLAAGAEFVIELRATVAAGTDAPVPPR